MDQSNLGHKDTKIEKPIITAKLNPQDTNPQGHDSQDIYKPKPDTQDHYTQALDNLGLEKQELYTQPFDSSKKSEARKPDTLKQDIREPDMQSSPVHAFENKVIDLPGVASVSLSGYLDREVRIEVSPDRMEKYCVSMTQVMQAIEKRNIR